MQVFGQAIKEARAQGYLVTGVRRSWLGSKVAWRRYCTSRKQPAVIVRRRQNSAYVYMFLRNVPHANREDDELEALVHGFGTQADEEKIRVIRGVRGKPDLFLGLCIENLSHDRAMALAPFLVEQAHALMQEEDQVTRGA